MVGTSQAQLVKAETGVTKVYTVFAILPAPIMTSNPAFVPVAAFTNTGLETEQYYLHPDHLGSSNYITNIAGEVSQHTEYFAFGETFVEEHKGSNNSPYKFNGKELDNESGLYYYGARYYDPRISIWASVDPLADYNPVMNDEHYIDGEHNGGIENSFNHASYSYCYQSPVKYIDPNGKQNVAAALGGALLGGIIGGGIEATRQYLKYGSVRDWKMVRGSAVQGAIVGGVAGFTNGASLIVTATSAGAANAVGGTANRLINGEETTVSDIAIDFTVGAVFGAGCKYIGNKAAQIIARNNLLKELSSNGINFTKSNILGIGKNAAGKIVFLESGNLTSGLKHIIEKHGKEFVKAGIAQKEIPKFLMQAAINGEQVGVQGSRPIFETIFNGVKQRVAITISNNGFIVGANIVSKSK